MILGVLQARASSRRLPGKVLKPILGRPMLALQIERLGRCRTIDRLVLATSTGTEDDPVGDVASTCGIECFRGSLDDVLDRFYQAARSLAPSHVVRLTGDCPLADWDVIDRVVSFAIEGGYDYASNALEPTWPDGLDVEVVTFAALETAWQEATSAFDREHVLEYVVQRPQRFKLGNVENDVDLSALRWTVDEPADLELVTRIYEALYPGNPAFATQEILAFFAGHPALAALNARIERNEGSKPAPADPAAKPDNANGPTAEDR